jgi:hypothetical protein
VAVNNDKKQTKGKRFLIGFLDAIFVIFLSSILSVIATIPVANAMGLSKTGQKINLITNDTGLFKLNNVGTYELITADGEKPEALYRYYVGFTNDKAYSSGEYSPRLSDAEVNTAELYYTEILRKGQADTPFDFSKPISDTAPWRVAVLDGKAEEANALYTEEFNKAYDSFLKNETLVSLTTKASNLLTGALLVGFYLSALILIVIFPLFFKDAKTLGMLITHSSVANFFGYKITKGQNFLRGITAFILYYVLFFIPIHVISLVVLTVGKKRRSLVDYISGTDIYPSEFVIYQNADEEYKYKVQLAKTIAAHNRRRKELGDEPR